MNEFVLGVMVLLALGLLTSTFAYIPKAALAGVIISAVVFMVEYEMVPLLWRTKSVLVYIIYIKQQK